ncbi:MAG: polyprenyl synthetase family protein [Chloroflexi bacterium]|nr:polyprenyl synthetase family protein [Chloroflexota bacterium]
MGLYPDPCTLSPEIEMDEYLIALENELRALVASPDSAYAAYYGIFRYHLGWTDAQFVEVKCDTGKRLRPLLCLLSCEASCGDWRRALPVAAALELAHNFSLIHDDIEDNSDERRGRVAVWKVWGLAHGLNAGDGMFVLARLALDRLCERGFDDAKCTAISRVFDEATLALCQGQFLDLGFETRIDVTTDEYLQMIGGKTAALIAASTRIGAMLATDDAHIVAAFARFGENIGRAFQITDDILGIWGDPSVTGKSAATDILTKKKSLPALIGLNDPQNGAALRALYSQNALSPNDVARVLALLDHARAREHAQRYADEFRAAALSALDATGIKNRALERLREMAEAMTKRAR